MWPLSITFYSKNLQLDLRYVCKKCMYKNTYENQVEKLYLFKILSNTITWNYFYSRKGTISTGHPLNSAICHTKASLILIVSSHNVLELTVTYMQVINSPTGTKSAHIQKVTTNQTDSGIVYLFSALNRVCFVLYFVFFCVHQLLLCEYTSKMPARPRKSLNFLTLRRNKTKDSRSEVAGNNIENDYLHSVSDYRARVNKRRSTGSVRMTRVSDDCITFIMI